jgi:tetratricopeptide (TPR) repeat protein
MSASMFPASILPRTTAALTWPLSITALKGIASLYFNQKKFDQAKQYHRKVLEVDPNDPETYYSIGVIDWTQAYQPRMTLYNSTGVKADEPLKDKKACEDLHTKNQDVVDEGIKMLDQAIKLRKDYDDAMAYLNLMYREKAAIECDDPVQRQVDLKTADDWVEKTMATKRAKAEKQNKQGGIVMDENGQSR